MGTHDTATGVVWRGSPAATADDAAIPVPAEPGKQDRVLVLVRSSGNRARLVERLGKRFEVRVSPEQSGVGVEAFDLAVVDAGGLSQWYEFLVNAKIREEPSFLPIVLVVPRRELKQRLRRYWDIVDEFVSSPIDPGELVERASMLIHIRHLALAQRSHLAYLVNHDRATGLPNKHLFMERLTNAIRDAAVIDSYVHAAVIHIPMDRVLKSLGHRGLERAAAIWSSRLQGMLADDVALARVTTEGWAFVGRIGMPLDALVELCQRVREISNQVLEIDGERLHFRPRIGIGTYPSDAADAAGTLDCALSALSQGDGTNPIFYSQDTQRRALRFIRTEARLHEAVEQEQFEVWLQPQVAVEDEALVGAEALVRWRLPSGEIVAPDDFLAVASSTGLITRIDAWVLENAMRTVREWYDDGADVGKLSVNVAVPDLYQEEFVEQVIRTLERHGVPPPRLELELTEDMFLECNDIVLARLQRLREHGVGIAIDDFGTGYSSLGYLHSLPITTLKIDKRFLERVNSDATNDAITRSIIWLASNFDLDIVAEGVETREQADYVRALGVGRGQGFLFGRPTATDEFRDRFLDRG